MSGSKKKKGWWMDRPVLVLNLILLFGLAASYAGSTVSPAQFWPLAFFAMAYPIFLGSSIIFMIYWFIRRRWFLFLNIAFLLIRPDHVAATFQMGPGTAETDSTGIRVMSYNVRLFDYYNWSSNMNTRHWIYDFLFNQQPDILCLQEFYHDRTGYFPTVDTLMQVNSIKHMHIENYHKSLSDAQLWGIATLTGYPIIAKGRIDFSGTYGNLCIFTDVLIDEDTVRIYNLHLQSIRIGTEGYRTIDRLMDRQEIDDVNDGRQLISRMKNGFIKRAAQADLVGRHISRCPYPIILCGDFNDVPTSYAYSTIGKGSEDTFGQSGTGLGNTYVRVPFFRIDNILYGPKFKALSHTVHPYELSDHFAVSAVLTHRK